VLDDIKPYLKLGIPNSLMLIYEWWAFEIMTIMSGMLGVNEQAAQIILFTLVQFFFQVPLGL